MMATEILEISGIGSFQEVKTKAEAPAAKPCKAHKCNACGIKTYQKDGMCVLCTTGITQIAKMVESLKIANEQEWA